MALNGRKAQAARNDELILEAARQPIVVFHPEKRRNDEGAFVRDGEPAAKDLLVLAAGAAPGVPVGELALAHPLRRLGSDEAPAYRQSRCIRHSFQTDEAEWLRKSMLWHR